MSTLSTPSKDTSHVRETLASIRSMLEYNSNGATAAAANSSRFRQRPLFTFASGPAGDGANAAGINNGAYSRIPANNAASSAGTFNRSPSSGGNSVSGNPNAYRNSPARSSTPGGGVPTAYLLQCQRDLERTQREKHDAERRCMELETQLIDAQTQVERLLHGLPNSIAGEAAPTTDDEFQVPQQTREVQQQQPVDMSGGAPADDGELLIATAKAIAAIHSVYGPGKRSMGSGSRASSAGPTPYGSVHDSASSPATSLNTAIQLPSADSSPSTVLTYLMERIGDLDSAIDLQRSLEAERDRLIHSQQANAAKVKEMIEEVEASEAERQNDMNDLKDNFAKKESDYKKLLDEKDRELAKQHKYSDNFRAEVADYKKEIEELKAALSEKVNLDKGAGEQNQLLVESLNRKLKAASDTSLNLESHLAEFKSMMTKSQIEHQNELAELARQHALKEKESKEAIEALQEECRELEAEADTAKEEAAERAAAQLSASAAPAPATVSAEVSESFKHDYQAMLETIEELTDRLIQSKAGFAETAANAAEDSSTKIQRLEEAVNSVIARTEKDQQDSAGGLSEVAEQLTLWQDALTSRQQQLINSEKSLNEKARLLAKKEEDMALSSTETTAAILTSASRPTAHPAPGSSVDAIDEDGDENSNKPVHQLQTELLEAKERIAELEEECKQLTEDMQSTMMLSTEKENKITDLEAAMEAHLITFKTTEESLGEELANAEETIQQLEAENNELSERLDHQKAESQAAVEKAVEVERSKHAAKDEEDSKADVVEELELELGQKDALIKALKDDLEAVSSRLEGELKSFTETHKNEVETLQKQLEAQEEVISELEDRATAAEEAEAAAKEAVVGATKTQTSDPGASSYASYSPEAAAHRSEGMEMTQRALEDLSDDYESLSDAYDRVVEMLSGIGINYSPYKRTDGEEGEDSDSSDHGDRSNGSDGITKKSPSRGSFDRAVLPTIVDHDPLYMPKWSLMQVQGPSSSSLTSHRHHHHGHPITISVEVKRFKSSSQSAASAGGWPTSSEVVGSARPLFDDSLPELAPVTEIPADVLSSSEFDAFAWQVQANGNLMVSVAMSVFRDFEIPSAFVEEATFHRYVTVLQRGYRDDNAYHSSTHAADVAQFFAHALHLTGLIDVLAPTEKLACLVAALAHDFEHPGRNNDYLNKIRDPISIRYGGQKVLEAHHAAAALELLQHPDLDFTSKFSPVEVNKFRATFTGLIYTTDMATHFDHLQTYSERLAKSTISTQASTNGATTANLGFDDRTVEADRLLSLQSLMHMVDIGNVARPGDVADRWSQAIREENWSQGDDEKKSKVPIASPLFDRAVPPNPNNTFFIDVFALPLAKVLAFRFNGFQPVVDQILNNRRRMVKDGANGPLSPEQEAAAASAAAPFDPQACLTMALKKYTASLPPSISAPQAAAAAEEGTSPSKKATTDSNLNISDGETKESLSSLLRDTQADVASLLNDKELLLADLEKALDTIERLRADD